jgi:hypothetical protein
MDSTHTAYLDIPELSKAASVAHIFPAMKKNSLLSVGQLCDEGYSVMFSISEVTILDSKHKALLKGSQYLDTGLWRINLLQKELQTRSVTANTQTQISDDNNVYNLRNTVALVNYMQRLCSAVPSMLSSILSRKAILQRDQA